MKTSWLALLILLLLVSPSLPQSKRTKAKSKTPSAKPKAIDPAVPILTPTPPEEKAAEKKEEDCGCEIKAPPDVFAEVGGIRISGKEIDGQIAEDLKKLTEQVSEIRKRAPEWHINNLLVDLEAQKRGISIAKLYQSEVNAKVRTPTAADAKAFYEQNQQRIRGQFEEVSDQIIDYLREQQKQELAQSFTEKLRTSATVTFFEKESTPPKNESDRARLFAIVNGRPVTVGDIEDALRPATFQIEEKMYDLRKVHLDDRIGQLLFDAEARKRNVTTAALFDSEIKPKMKAVGDTEARDFYNLNKAQLDGDFESLKPQIIAYLTQSEQRNAQNLFVAGLRKSYAVTLYLQEPQPPVLHIATDDQPTKGNPQAQVTIIEFTDFQCPSCARVHPVLEKILHEFGDKIRLVVRDFPLDQHAQAAKAAEAAEAAREQGRYWEYSALLFANQTALAVEDLKKYASQLGLDRQKFDAALDSGQFAEKVQRDLLEGDKLGINGTPTVFINGRQIRDKTYENLKAAIEAALKKSEKKAMAAN